VEGSAHFVKVDAQGSEGLVLDGMRALVERSPHLILLAEFCPYLLEQSGTAPGDFLKQLRALGFEIFEVSEDTNSVNMCEEVELLERVSPEYKDSKEGYTNLLCTRPRGSR
jgi:hypothetical protein